jgi:RluA family pseudouridine synthase
MSIYISVADHILFEDDYIMVLHKPCSLMVEPDRNGHPNLQQQVKKYLKSKGPAGQEIYAQHIHRLDRPVSGIILFAKQRSVLKNLSEQFAERRVKKYYQALTAQAPPQTAGTLQNWFKKEKKKALLFDDETEGTEKMTLHYTVENFQDNRFLWNIELHTGKFHQIRAQLSHAGCPIIGDHLYQSPLPYKPDSIALHACKLVFLHPVSNEEMVMVKAHDFV